MDEQIVWSPGVTLADIEKQVILKAFRFFRGNKTTTSNALGISIRTLDARLDEYEQFGKDMENKSDKLRQDREQFLARQRGNPTSNQYGSSVLTASPAPVANAVGQNRVVASTGVRVEPASEIKPQPVVPVPERKEVQSVSPKHHSSGHSKRSR